ncbi:TPA: hypothetical protein ACQWG9_000643 [Neisseria subflava]|jgi:hypothetical protein|uniref:hypothetical protein n=1 Tax=unclassified Neisseria TaxID=2623750 RepID=UPI0035FC8828
MGFLSDLAGAALYGAVDSFLNSKNYKSFTDSELITELANSQNHNDIKEIISILNTRGYDKATIKQILNYPNRNFLLHEIETYIERYSNNENSELRDFIIELLVGNNQDDLAKVLAVTVYLQRNNVKSRDLEEYADEVFDQVKNRDNKVYFVSNDKVIADFFSSLAGDDKSSAEQALNILGDRGYSCFEIEDMLEGFYRKHIDN